MYRLFIGIVLLFTSGCCHKESTRRPVPSTVGVKGTVVAIDEMHHESYDDSDDSAFLEKPNADLVDADGTQSDQVVDHAYLDWPDAYDRSFNLQEKKDPYDYNIDDVEKTL